MTENLSPTRPGAGRAMLFLKARLSRRRGANRAEPQHAGAFGAPVLAGNSFANTTILAGAGRHQPNLTGVAAAGDGLWRGLRGRAGPTGRL